MSPSSLPDTTPSLRGRFRAATRDAILEAAAAVCARDGAAQLRMEEIAASAGVENRMSPKAAGLITTTRRTASGRGATRCGNTVPSPLPEAVTSVSRGDRDMGDTALP